MSEKGRAEDIAALRAAVERLEERVSALESRRLPISLAAANEDDLALPDPAIRAAAEPDRSHEIFTRLAVVCFVLVGGLILRVFAQRGLIDPAVGTAIGLAYAAVLLAAPLLGSRISIFSRQAVLFQALGLVLAPVILVEMNLSYQALSPRIAVIVLGALGLIGLAVADRQRRRIVGVAAALCSIAALPGTGVAEEGVVLATAVLTILTAAALVVAHRRDWGAVRAAALVPAAAALAVGVLFSARRDTLPPQTTPALLAGVGVVWLMVAMSHIRRASRLTTEEALWLPLVTFWAYTLVAFAVPSVAPIAGSVAAFLLLGGAAVLGRRAETPDASHAGLVSAAALLGIFAIGAADPTGLGVAVLAVAVWACNRRRRLPVLGVFSRLLGLVAIGVACVRAPLLYPEQLGTPALVIAPILGAVLLFHFRVGHAYAWADQRATVERNVSALSLIAALLAFFLAARAVAFRALGAGSSYELTLTLVIAAFTVGCLEVTRRTGSRAWRATGLIGVVLVALKVGLWDLPSLEGAHGVFAVVALGIVFGYTSFALRRHHDDDEGMEDDAPADPPAEPGSDSEPEAFEQGTLAAE